MIYYTTDHEWIDIENGMGKVVFPRTPLTSLVMLFLLNYLIQAKR